MITNFEEITKELNAFEKRLLPLLIKGFSAHSKNDPIKAPEIIKLLNSQKVLFGLEYKVTQARLRKMINFIRCNSLLPVIGTSKGYYVSNNRIEIEKQVQSLRERADAINAAADGLQELIID